MSDTKIHGFIWYTCDECHEALETGATSFITANRIMKEKGWISAKIGGDWKNFCSNTCIANYKREVG